MRHFFLLTALFVSLHTYAQRSVAFTFDDLPLGGGGKAISLEEMIRINDRIVRTCNQYKVPATGFVNEKKLVVPGEMDRRVGILQTWLDAGLLLGNHTFSHPSLFKTPLEDFEADVLKGEVITRKLMSDMGLTLSWFRHPFLNTGPDSVTRASFEQFLAAHGYTVAPVTVESSDYIFNKVYIDALQAGDSALMKETGESYVQHTLQMFEFAEEATQKILGRPIPHIFLCHANLLNADYIEAIYTGLADRGYGFVRLDEALEDPAYASEDRYIGAWGISWLYRWDGEHAQKWLKTEPPVDEKFLTLYRN